MGSKSIVSQIVFHKTYFVPGDIRGGTGSDLKVITFARVGNNNVQA